MFHWLQLPPTAKFRLEFASSFKRCCGKGSVGRREARFMNTVRMTSVNSSRYNINLVNLDKHKLHNIHKNHMVLQKHKVASSHVHKGAVVGRLEVNNQEVKNAILTADDGSCKKNHAATNKYDWKRGSQLSKWHNSKFEQ